MLLLAACAGKEPPGPCPTVVAVPDARQLVRFAGEDRDLTDVLFEARLEDAVLICDYEEDVIEAQMRVRFLAVRGPAERDRLARFSYFVAIATREQEIAAREEFELAVPFEGNRTRVLATEELTPRIPLGAGQGGQDYVIYVGLALSPEEFRYNRENR